MLKVGITGQAGFVGKHLFNAIGLHPKEFVLIDFKRHYFDDESKLNEFVSECDVIVHLAGMNRHNDPQTIYNTNIDLAKKIIKSLEFTDSRAHVIFSSSTQEENENLYGKSKKDSRELFVNWAKRSKGKFTGMIIPNVFGPFGHPNYNSVVATFSHKIARNEIPKIEVDNTIKLIYVGELVEVILEEIKKNEGNHLIQVKHTSECTVSKLLSLLNSYKEQYQDKGQIPVLDNKFELNLFNTYRCYIDFKEYFPVKFTQHADERGSFVEIIRLGVGGQVSFSTTVPGITRGNHFHTRKIERFAVIKGKALIQLRRIDSDEILEFYLDGDNPAYVDMPIWYTHNIKNIGSDILYTNFWINEFFDPNDPDTYLLEV
ncbi:NAD-dependent epimerase/dehydratase family protein [Flavobacterium endoglycinae]|uniref:NAD-dependent epimerase/dehydratase family protein n=1 Tax=Flavobacterium endoglycinae TaxID=2816357 RepID=A0ABX7Q947_9FLAO|nr:NAD-dependent epimerase/dehydratase family protein [Flavobacterium endoglycinae]QSW87462.1 NAD-dependent epimerase/dehydratase family protein [Flavobacterium endoglycinae]